MTAIPGFTQQAVATPRQVWRQEGRSILAETGIWVSGAASVDQGGSSVDFKRLRGGWLMGKITSSGRWTNAKVARVQSTSTVTQTLEDANPFQVGDTVSVDGAGTFNVDAITATTIVLDSNPVASPGDVIRGISALAGADIARGILSPADELDFHDEDNNIEDKQSVLGIQGFAFENVILGDLVTGVADGFLSFIIFDTTQLALN